MAEEKTLQEAADQQDTKEDTVKAEAAGEVAEETAAPEKDTADKAETEAAEEASGKEEEKASDGAAASAEEEEEGDDGEVLTDDEWEYESYGHDVVQKTDREIRREESHPMFETETVYSYEEYLRYYKMLESKISHVWLKRIAMVVLVVIFVSIMKVRGYGSITTMAILIGLAVLMPIITEVTQRSVLKKRFSQNDSADLVSHIRMYEDHFSQSSKMGDTRFNYSDIYRIIETKTNFYIMENKYNGLILVKENCSKEMLDAVMDIWNQMEGGDAGTAKYDPSKEMQSDEKK